MKRVAVEVIILKEYPKGTARFFPRDKVWVTAKFADELEAAEFWYKTSQEKNISLMQKSKEERRKLLKTKSRYGDLSEILFPALNPDKVLSWLTEYTSFVYTPWFTLVTLAAFAFSASITITHWSEIGRDTLEFDPAGPKAQRY